MSFDRLVVVDWSARSKPSPEAPTKDAIYICHSNNFEMQNTEYFRTRRAALKFIEKLIEKSLVLKNEFLLVLISRLAIQQVFQRLLPLPQIPFLFGNS